MVPRRIKPLDVRAFHEPNVKRTTRNSQLSTLVERWALNIERFVATHRWTWWDVSALVQQRDLELPEGENPQPKGHCVSSHSVPGANRARCTVTLTALVSRGIPKAGHWKSVAAFGPAIPSGTAWRVVHSLRVLPRLSR